jgi:single-strand DNA-binding protein
MNKVILLGRLTNDVELKQTPSGVSVASFTIAVKRRFAKEGQQDTDFINCVAWRNNAEFVSKFFGKGKMIGIVGSLQTGKYEKDGQTHYTTDVLVDEVHFAEGKSSTAPATTPTSENTFADTDGFIPIDSSDDLPFFN